MPQLSPTYGIMIFILTNFTLFIIILVNNYHRTKKIN